MLKRLLNRVYDGGSFTTRSLALEFGVSIELMESMLADLARAGRLQSLEQCASDACSGCGLANTCRNAGRAYLLPTYPGQGKT